MTVGVFDLLHEGHVNLLKAMREAGDLTAILLHDGPSTFRNKGRFPVQGLYDRAGMLLETGLVDMVRFIRSADPEHEIAEFLDHITRTHEVIYVRGDDWPAFPGRGVLEYRQIPIILKPYTKGVSSTQIRSAL